MLGKDKPAQEATDFPKVGLPHFEMQMPLMILSTNVSFTKQSLFEVNLLGEQLKHHALGTDPNNDDYMRPRSSLIILCVNLNVEDITTIEKQHLSYDAK